MTYCDSSFLTSLYVTTDVFNPQARQETARFTKAIPYTLLHEIELLNVLHRGIGTGSLDQTSTLKIGATGLSRPGRALREWLRCGGRHRAGSRTKVLILSKKNRGDRIRTCDLLVPNQALYQAKLRPDNWKIAGLWKKTMILLKQKVRGPKHSGNRVLRSRSAG